MAGKINIELLVETPLDRLRAKRAEQRKAKRKRDAKKKKAEAKKEQKLEEKRINNARKIAKRIEKNAIPVVNWVPSWFK